MIGQGPWSSRLSGSQGARSRLVGALGSKPSGGGLARPGSQHGPIGSLGSGFNNSGTSSPLALVSDASSSGSSSRDRVSAIGSNSTSTSIDAGSDALIRARSSTIHDHSHMFSSNSLGGSMHGNVSSKSPWRPTSAINHNGDGRYTPDGGEPRSTHVAGQSRELNKAELASIWASPAGGSKSLSSTPLMGGSQTPGAGGYGSRGASNENSAGQLPRTPGNSATINSLSHGLQLLGMSDADFNSAPSGQIGRHRASTLAASQELASHSGSSPLNSGQNRSRLPFSVSSLGVSPRMPEVPISESSDDYFTMGALRNGASNNGTSSPSMAQQLASVALLNRLGGLGSPQALNRPRASTMLASSSAQDHESDSRSSYGLSAEDTARLAAAAAGRARAGTVAALSGPGSRRRTEMELGRINGLPASQGIASSATASHSSPSLRDGSLFDTPLLEEETDMESSLMSGALDSDSATPYRTGGGNQVPSRSLWIGNLDPSVTAQDLMHAFAPYGAIESLRLLAEKECGFVNFMEMDDAKRARDDVLTRLNGMIPTVRGKQAHPVRIGFGRIDAPGTSSATWPYAGAIQPSAAAVAGNDIDGPPTRALWLGSIPATTSQTLLLSIFSQYGPVESVRILSQKNCAFSESDCLAGSSLTPS